MTPITQVIDKILSNLADKLRNKLNVGKRYGEGRISNGVAKGLRSFARGSLDLIAKPNNRDIIPKITIGNMYKISLGHPGSP